MENRIYIASLSDYNAGRLHGVWIELDGKDAEEVHAEIQKMLKASKEPIAEEYAIHDFELPFHVGEFEQIETIVNRLEVFEGMEEEEREAAAAHADNIGLTDPEEIKESHEERYRGIWKDEQDFAWSILEDNPAWIEGSDLLTNYFDIESYTRDLFIGDFTAHKLENGKVAVYSDY